MTRVILHNAAGRRRDRRTGMATKANADHPAEEVRAALDEAGLSVIDAAARIGVSRQQLTRLLGRKSALSPEMALRLQSVFGLSARRLLETQLERDLSDAGNKLGATLSRLAAFKQAHEPPAREEVLRRLRRHKREIAAAGVEKLFLFGSVARGEARAGSDVDLYFEPSPSASIGLVELGKLKTRIEEILGRKTDLVPGDSFRPHVRSRVTIDAVRVF